MGSTFITSKERYIDQFPYGRPVAQPAERRSWLRKLVEPPLRGLIERETNHTHFEVHDGPISSVVLSKINDSDAYTPYKVTYFVPDRRLASIPQCKDWKVSTYDTGRTLIVFGRVTPAGWSGRPDFLIQTLNQDARCLPLRGEKQVYLKARQAQSCWLLETWDDGWRLPSRELWTWLQAVGSKMRDQRFPFGVYS